MSTRSTLFFPSFPTESILFNELSATLYELFETTVLYRNRRWWIDLYLYEMICWTNYRYFTLFHSCLCYDQQRTIKWIPISVLSCLWTLYVSLLFYSFYRHQSIWEEDNHQSNSFYSSVFTSICSSPFFLFPNSFLTRYSLLFLFWSLDIFVYLKKTTMAKEQVVYHHQWILYSRFHRHLIPSSYLHYCSIHPKKSLNLR